MKLSHIIRFMFVSAVYLAGGGALAADAGSSTGGTASSATQPQASTSSTTSTSSTSMTQANSSSTGQNQVVGQIAGQFSSFAGSTANADSLALGLRNGTAVTLTAGSGTQASTTTFTPPTGHMGFGNVTRALTLAQRELAALGITQPTPQQLQAALMGGTVTTGSGSTAQTVTLPGVLQLRSQGMGWGQIAHTIRVFPGNKGGLSAGALAGAGIRTGANTSAAVPMAGRVSSAQRVKQENEVEVENEADNDHHSGTVASGITTGVGASAGGLTTAAGASASESLHSERGIVQAGGSSGFAFSGGARQSGIVTGAGGAAGGLTVGRGHGKH